MNFLSHCTELATASFYSCLSLSAHIPCHCTGFPSELASNPASMMAVPDPTTAQGEIPDPNQTQDNPEDLLDPSFPNFEQYINYTEQEEDSQLEAQPSSGEQREATSARDHTHQRYNRRDSGDLAAQKSDEWADILKAYKQLGDSLPVFQHFKATEDYNTEFTVFKTFHNNRARNIREVDNAREQVPERWPTVGHALLAIQPSQGWACNLKTISGMVPEQQVIDCFNRAIINHVTDIQNSGSCGYSYNLTPCPANLTKARELPANFLRPTAEEIAGLGLFLDQLGLVTRKPPAEQSYAATEPSATPTPTLTQQYYWKPALTTSREDEGNKDLLARSPLFTRPGTEPEGSPMPQDRDAHSKRSAQDEPEPAGKPMSITMSPTPRPEMDNTHSERSAQDEPKPAGKPMSVTASPTPCPEVDNTHSERSAQDEPEPAVQLTPSTPQTTPMTSNKVLDAEILELAGEAMTSEPGTDPAAQDNPPVPCTCVTNELFLPKDAAAISMHPKLKTLHLMIWAIKDHLVQAARDTTFMCNNHTRAIGQALGLKSTNFNNIRQQLAVIAPHTETLIKFKLFIHKNANIAIWFKEPNFVINREWDAIIKDITSHVDSLQTDPRAILATSGYVDINVYGNSAEQQELHQAALAEANIIRHHTKTVGSTRWPHQFSIVQQILNQDLLYYLLNVCLRPGHPYQLCAYPQPVIDTANLTDSDPEEPFY
ncbi:hypothetical protein BDW59DRAFT_168072, partial [Aspergillus cavernicola]